MTRYLVVYDTASGFTELANVGIFEAESNKEAAIQACNSDGCWPDPSLWFKCAVYEINLLKSGWAYFL